MSFRGGWRYLYIASAIAAPNARASFGVIVTLPALAYGTSIVVARSMPFNSPAQRAQLLPALKLPPVFQAFPNGRLSEAL